MNREGTGSRGKDGITLRAVLLGLLLTALTDFWLHWAELVLGGRGHTALAGTSTPVGAFSMLFALVIINVILTRLAPRSVLRPTELLVIYTMMTVSTVISSSGGLHFIVPTITAAFYYANSSNVWASVFHRYIPRWMAQTDDGALYGFYVGNATVPWRVWLPQIGSWSLFIVLVALAGFCLVSILRRQWIDRERLTFPTVAVPLQLIQEGPSALSSRVMWIGFLIPFSIDLLNTIHLNVPVVPYIPTRTSDQPDLGLLLTNPPWNAIGPTPISLYPFVIGIAYLLTVEVSLSCWFFWLVTKLEMVLGAASGVSAGPASAGQSAFPYIGHQGAGAFVALTVIGLWLSRRYIAETVEIATGRLHANSADSDEPMSYRWAYIGLIASLCGLVAWCVAAGMRPVVAVTVLLISLTYMVAATRIRAETGNAWLFGPDIDAYKLMTTTFGTTVYTAADLTVLAYLRSAIASFDLRCISMPHQADALRMADQVGQGKRRLARVLVLAIVLGTIVSFAIALMVWYNQGAGAKTDAWRTSMGRLPFDQLKDTLATPVHTDVSGSCAVATGFVFTGLLMLARSLFTWWPLHPVGYAIANTITMNQVWLPFFIAWVAKTTVLRYGGIRLYRATLPFAYGVIMGDFIAGGLTTAIGCLTGINIYATNW